MHRPRPPVIALATLFTFGVTASQQTAAQSNPLPQGRMTVVVGFQPGGPLDVVARLVAERIGPRIERTIVVEHKPGAAGNLAATAIVKGAADGLTILAALDTAFTVNPHVYKAPGFALEELAPLAITGQFDLMLGVHPTVPVASVRDLVTFAKSNPVSFASGGNGSPGHLAFEYLRMVTGIEAKHVPYRGAAPATNDLLAGHVQAAFIVSSPMLAHVAAGKIKALAVSTPARIAAAPDVPTAMEAGVKDFEAVFAFLMLVPAATPQTVRDHLTSNIVAVLGEADVKAKLAIAGIGPVTAGPVEARAWIAREGARWQKVIEASGMKVE